VSTFSRDDLERYLSLLVDELRGLGANTNVRIVGGAALALRYFERATTTDIDAMTIGDDDLLGEAVRRVAERHGLPDNWLNEEARKYVPVWGRMIDWETVYDRDGVVVQIAPVDALLAMKLRANRPGRDEKDIARLVAIGGISGVREAEELFESFYPGDALTDRALRMLERALEMPPPVVSPPPTIRLENES
jgi:hypothetical protein